MTLAELSISQAVGRRARLISLSGPQDLVDRMREMGFYEGATMDVVRRLPFRGPWIVQVGASQFALRDEEARCARLEWISA